jgi:hypothetical protein
MDAFVYFVPKLVGGGMFVPSEKINPMVQLKMVDSVGLFFVPVLQTQVRQEQGSVKLSEKPPDPETDPRAASRRIHHLIVPTSVLSRKPSAVSSSEGFFLKDFKKD